MLQPQAVRQEWLEYRRPTLVERDYQHLEPVSFTLERQSLKPWEFPDARRTPGGPKVHKQWLTGKVVKLDGSPVGAYEGRVGRGRRLVKDDEVGQTAREWRRPRG